MLVSYDAYRIFYYVAKYRSFTKAAAALLASQPNVTRAIKGLETALGCTLFVRSNRGVQLTPEGELLYSHIAIAFEQIARGEEALALEQSLGSGVVTIGASETALHCLLLPVLKAFRADYPGVRIRVSNHSTPQAIAALKNGQVDFAVVSTPLDTSDLLKETSIRTIHEVAVCGAAFADLAERQVTLAELTEYPLVMLGQQTKTYEFYARLFLSHGLTLRADLEAATADQILPMVKHDLGIGFVPEQFVLEESDQRAFCVLNLAEKIPPRDLCLVKRTDRSLTLAAKTLERMILAECGEK